MRPALFRPERHSAMIWSWTLPNLDGSNYGMKNSLVMPNNTNPFFFLGGLSWKPMDEFDTDQHLQALRALRLAGLHEEAVLSCLESLVRSSWQPPAFFWKQRQVITLFGEMDQFTLIPEAYAVWNPSFLQTAKPISGWSLSRSWVSK